MFEPADIPEDLNGSAELFEPVDADQDFGGDGDQVSDPAQIIVDSPDGGQQSNKGAEELGKSTAASEPEPYELPSIGYKTSFTPEQRKALSEAGLDGLLDRFRHVDERARQTQSWQDKYTSLAERTGGDRRQNDQPAPQAEQRRSAGQTVRELAEALPDAFAKADADAVAGGSLSNLGKSIQAVLITLAQSHDEQAQRIDQLSSGVDLAYSGVETSLIDREIAAINQTEETDIPASAVLPFYDQIVQNAKSQGHSDAAIRKALPSIAMMAYDAAVRAAYKQTRVSAQANPTPTGAIQGRAANPPARPAQGSSRPATGPTQSRQKAPVPSGQQSVYSFSDGDANRLLLP